MELSAQWHVVVAVVRWRTGWNCAPVNCTPVFGFASPVFSMKQKFHYELCYYFFVSIETLENR